MPYFSPREVLVQEMDCSQLSDSWNGRREPWRPRHGGHQLPTHRGARGRRGRHTVTSRCHYYSTTSNWVKLLSVPESPLPGLYATAAFQVQQLLMVCEDSTPWCVDCGVWTLLGPMHWWVRWSSIDSPGSGLRICRDLHVTLWCVYNCRAKSHPWTLL